MAKGKKRRSAPEVEAAVRQKRVPAIFFRTEAGGEPVREWLKSLSREDRKQIGADIMTVEFGWPMGMPVCRPLGHALYEVRTSLGSNRIARVLFILISAAAWSCCMASSRKRRRHRLRTLVSPPATRANMSEV